ncbi:bifunctional diaminohydroxyphosphoribosylaminopyrimidine deaminase/5-amino-6-(5-phosphoribosylamino)uracil reductase RibD [Flavobacterium sp. CYK-4]|nr:bifunctional diaminohydroxyphosphoribosylaminopyrimidine deaminase/5-amino-6-(5-phosphoribosylamino)uracil reductase RibD [Flavobacterium lotistagni]NHM07324.1 bifunctional diaminohydroxyphosphoribosylaminopyrimidine deaminase/5-amino-6-(5-phosphoribosylamino)uracil reductase RibD [Flavobacterium lotistagni]
MKIHEKYMRRCLALAKKGFPAAMPNPSVGAVIVCDGKIIGEGFTSAYGGAHAEVGAIAAVKDQKLLKKSTLYVSLEPCSHFGKTPPCCDLIIKHQIPNVIIGATDPNPKVAGEGIQKIIAANSTVITGVLEQECIEINRRFFTFHNEKRPYIILKWAQSKDGFIAPKSKEQQAPHWISNVYSRQLTHKWRSEEQAILVGAQTVIDDNPKLNVRDWTGQNPIKIVLDPCGRISKESHIFGDSSETFLLNNEAIDFTQNVAEQIAGFLFKKGIQSVIIEGGRQTLQTFIDAKIWDEARVFIGPENLTDGVPAPILKAKANSRSHIIEDELLIYKRYDQHDYI